MKPFPDTHPTMFWQKLDNGETQCLICPRQCALKDGQRGFCFVRACQDGEIVLTTYGRSSGFCVDPIEKKPLNHFYPGTPVLSFGTAGCNLACKFCQNWNISRSRQVDTISNKASPSAIVAAAQDTACRSVAYTYNDPIIFMEYAVDTAKACREKGIKNVAVTAGYINPEPRNVFFEYMDATNIDLKAFSNDFYERLCGGALQPILDTLVYVKHETKVWLEITTLLIPGENDADSELKELTAWICKELGAETPLHFTAFHPDWKLMDHPPTSLKLLEKARQIAIDAGLKHVYTGNVSDERGSSTYCASCGKKLISRNWYTLGAWHLDENGCCEFCGHPCAGHFEDGPGKWGAQRLPVNMDIYR